MSSSLPLSILSRLALPPDVAAQWGASAFGPFVVEFFSDDAALAERLANPGFELLLLGADPGDTVRELVEQMAADTAILVVGAGLSAEATLDWLQRGVQEVLSPDELPAPRMASRLRAAVERKRLEREARKAYATDLDTGLPHQQQLIEHMSQLLALREREPSPMAVLVLRVEGLATTELRFGRDASQTLRRKLAVRLRAGVRTSDIVASIGDDCFAVLLGSILAPADAQRVAAKLLNALMEPFKLAASEVAVAVAIGIGQYPEDGDQPEALLRRASGLAAAAQAQGRAGLSNFVEAGSLVRGAANDD